MGLGIVDPSQPAPEYLKKGFRFQWCALVLYHTCPSLCVAYVLWLTGVGFWPSTILLSMPVAADLLRAVNAIDGRLFVAFRQRQSNGWLMRNLKPLHLVYPAVGLGAIIPYYMYSDLCLPWFNVFLAQHYPSYSWVQLKLGPVCTVPHVTVLMITFITLQLIFAALMALASFLLFVDPEKFRESHSIKTPRPIVFRVKKMISTGGIITRLIIGIIFFYICCGSLNYIQVMDWSYRRAIPFNLSITLYTFYIALSFYSVLYLTAGLYATRQLSIGQILIQRTDKL